jgi:1,4-dihydroxy-2-naphthoate octaprenyltransferase
MEDRATSISPVKAWWLAIRPRTLPAAMAPVIVACAMAWSDGVFMPLRALAALLTALLLQIGVNLANDYFDCRHGIDTPERLGPLRVTQCGLIAPATIKKGMVLTFAAAGLCGLYLTVVVGWVVVVIGVAAILAALAYSGGPYPLASHALGDLFVFLFFGVVAVCGTYYIQALTVSPLAFGVSMPLGFLITAILVVNNLRDIDTDRRAGKITLAVRLGAGRTRTLYAALCIGAYVLIVLYMVAGLMAWGGLLPLASLPLAVRRVGTVYTADGGALNKALADTAALALIFAISLAVGLIVSGPSGRLG